MTAQPGFDGLPVVLVHLLAREGSDIAYCAEVPYVPAENVDPNVPRVLCSRCRHGVLSAPSPKCTRCGTGIGWTRVIQGKTQCEACDLRAPVDSGSRERTA